MLNENSYLGDGLYVAWDGFMFTLHTQRGNQTHYVCLEPHALQAFSNFVKKCLTTTTTEKGNYEHETDGN